jgi:hypothetical protein
VFERRRGLLVALSRGARETRARAPRLIPRPEPACVCASAATPQSYTLWPNHNRTCFICPGLPQQVWYSMGAPPCPRPPPRRRSRRSTASKTLYTPLSYWLAAQRPCARQVNPPLHLLPPPPSRWREVAYLATGVAPPQAQAAVRRPPVTGFERLEGRVFLSPLSGKGVQNQFCSSRARRNDTAGPTLI